MTQRILDHRHRLVTDENSRWWTFGAMCFALFMVMLDNTVVNVSLPSIQRSNSWHWGSFQIIPLFAVAVLGLAAFIQIERTVRTPMIDFTFFRSRTSLGATWSAS